MAKYDDLYPNAENGSQSERLNNLPRVEKLACNDPNCKSDHKCDCGAVTYWYNITAQKCVCSTECNEQVWQTMILVHIAKELTYF